MDQLRSMAVAALSNMVTPLDPAETGANAAGD